MVEKRSVRLKIELFVWCLVAAASCCEDAPLQQVLEGL